MALFRCGNGGINIPNGYFIGVNNPDGSVVSSYESITGTFPSCASIMAFCKGYTTLSGTTSGLVSKINSDGTLTSLGNTSGGPVDISDADMIFINGQVGNITFTYTLA